ncbi:MAG: nucleotidyltransferase domain-containing protein [Bacteroidota bacterium]
MITYQTNEYGLRQKDMDFMLRLYEAIPTIEKVILYGSRATGTYERGSDVDLAIEGTAITFGDISKIQSLVAKENPSLLSYSIIHYERIENEKLKDQIDKYGKVVYHQK